jgi:glutamyl-tRNA synthetase
MALRLFSFPHSSLTYQLIAYLLTTLLHLHFMASKVRVRFAPSPTGGLHLGGVRTVLYNYLFAKKHNGKFILRIEDTDQSRYVPGAEQYIIDCLNWCGLTPDEGPHVGGEHAPYRQSERKALYRQYAEQLIKDGHAYYAFDTPEEIEKMRQDLKAQGKGSLHYDHHSRLNMRNSLNLSTEETQKLITQGTPYVIRIKVDPGQIVSFTDMIRGSLQFDTSNVDDKVLLKADGMPTYHLAVVVDDYLMKISHSFRGEEWLPSAPVHVLLWEHLGWRDDMPEWAHLPLILKPDGNGKLSKRDGDRLGFPVFAMNWLDPKSGELIQGFKELGFLPEAFINLLAVLGWNDGSEKEIYTMDELIDKFSIDRVHHAGAKFNFEKAKWFNHEWIKLSSAQRLSPDVKTVLADKGLIVTDEILLYKIIDLVKDRCTLLTDFYEQSSFFFKTPEKWDTDAVRPKWSVEKRVFFTTLLDRYAATQVWNTGELEGIFKAIAAEQNIKPGELQLPLRIMLVGGKFGPPVFEIANIIGREETLKRITLALTQIDNTI